MVNENKGFLEDLDELEEVVQSEVNDIVKVNQAKKRKEEAVIEESETKVNEPRKAGRPSTGQKRKVFSVSIDEDVIKEFNSVIKSKMQNKSLVVEELMKMYLEKNTEEL